MHELDLNIKLSTSSHLRCVNLTIILFDKSKNIYLQRLKLNILSVFYQIYV